MAVQGLIVFLLLSHALGLVTLESVREITNLTKDCTREIVDISRPGAEAWAGSVGQIQLGEAHGDRDGDDGELEDVSPPIVSYIGLLT